MALVRRIQIANFRGIRLLDWLPQPGINCLIGSGDSGKSTVLDAVDYCLGSRRTISVSDADFFNMDVSQPIQIDITIGGLADSLVDFDSYGIYLRGFNMASGAIEDEYGVGLEPALTVRFQVDDSLEPSWTLISDRAAAQGQTRNLKWADRSEIAPTRIGVYANHHMSWNKWSVLNRLNDEGVDASGALAVAAREARTSFGDTAGARLTTTLRTVKASADTLGIFVGNNVRAMLDPHSVSFTGGTIALHNENGIPLRNLGMGSSRLLVAGLQGNTAGTASIAIVDEVEMGLEPHRISRLLTALGSKSTDPKMQVFMTTHSPVVLRELNGSQLFVLRSGNPHYLHQAGHTPAVQGTLRLFPASFLGRSVLICEGATEVGLIRGIDMHRSDNSLPTLAAAGCVCLDANGVSQIYNRTKPFQQLGYQTAVLRDDDVQPDAAAETAFTASGGRVFKWSPGKALENELFDCVSEDAVRKLLHYAISIHGAQKIDAHLATAQQGPMDSATAQNVINPASRNLIGNAAKLGEWFKRISIMEDAARYIIAPDLAVTQSVFKTVTDSIFLAAVP